MADAQRPKIRIFSFKQDLNLDTIIVIKKYNEDSLEMKGILMGSTTVLQNNTPPAVVVEHYSTFVSANRLRSRQVKKENKTKI